MKKIVTYLIILGIFQLCARSFFELNKPDKIIQSAQAETKSTFIPYPENRVHRAGIFWLNVTNCGVLGNNGFGAENETFLDPCTGKKAASGDFPGGSDFEYLSLSSIWCGGYLDSAHIDINSNNSSIFQGPLVSTGTDGCLVWGWSNELWPVLMDDDPSGLTLGRISETSNVEGRMNCLFEEVYDPKTTAYEQFSTMFTDKHQSPDNWDPFGRQYHVPLGIEIKQTSYAWPYDYAKKFIIIDYTIYNRNSDKKDIYDFFIGVINDSNIGKRDTYCYRDDICGFIPKWEGYIDPATGERKTVDLNLVWTADNDGRSYISGDEWGLTIGSEPAAGNPLDEATGVLSIRVLRNPNPNLRYSFNIYSMDFYNESLDWGPRWKSGMHTDWKFDLTLKQRGYDDTNYDSLETGEPYFQKMFGGRTEGTPLGDNGRYMVMSNDEFDYDLTTIREVYLGMSTQSDGTPIPQADKWQSWIVTGTEQQYEVPDGRIEELNNVANGSPQEFLLSFGPLGNESYVNVAVDTDHDSLGIPDDFVNKKVWKFAYGDSLKLTLAFMVSENFHTSLEQDPNYRDSTIVDLSDGLDVSLFDQGWYDAYNNVIWAERVLIHLCSTRLLIDGERQEKTAGTVRMSELMPRSAIL